MGSQLISFKNSLSSYFDSNHLLRIQFFKCHNRAVIAYAKSWDLWSHSSPCSVVSGDYYTPIRHQSCWGYIVFTWSVRLSHMPCSLCGTLSISWLIVRRAGLLWSQQDFEWRWSVPLFKCLTVLEFSFILFDLCLLITFFNFIMNYVPIVTFWIFTYHKIWVLSIMFCFIWSYWIIYFLACLEVSWRVVS